MTTPQLQELPDWTVDQWFNSSKPISLSDLRGKVILVEAFQMLCPGCVAHSLPLAQQAHDLFPKDQLAVIGLHTVFEHHDAMKPISLKAFLHEYRITFPVGVDTPGKETLPITMKRYQLQGTPSLLLVDRSGNLRAHHFGQVSALQLGAELAGLINERALPLQAPEHLERAQCDEDGCSAEFD